MEATKQLKASLTWREVTKDSRLNNWINLLFVMLNYIMLLLQVFLSEVAEIVPFILKGILIIEQAGDGWLVLQIFKIEAKFEYQGIRLWVFI